MLSGNYCGWDDISMYILQEILLPIFKYKILFLFLQPSADKVQEIREVTRIERIGKIAWCQIRVGLAEFQKEGVLRIIQR